MRFLLYISPGIGTYAEDVDTFSERTAPIAGRVSGSLGARRRSTRRARVGASSWAQAAGATDPVAAGPHVARDARYRYVGGARVSVVSRAARRQFLVRSPAAAPVGDLCRAHA